jgi:hypothetical protein
LYILLEIIKLILFSIILITYISPFLTSSFNDKSSFYSQYTENFLSCDITLKHKSLNRSNKFNVSAAFNPSLFIFQIYGQNYHKLSNFRNSAVTYGDHKQLLLIAPSSHISEFCIKVYCAKLLILTLKPHFIQAHTATNTHTHTHTHIQKVMCSLVRYAKYVWLLCWNLKCCSPHSCRLHNKRLNIAAVRLRHLIHANLPYCRLQECI